MTFSNPEEFKGGNINYGDVVNYGHLHFMLLADGLFLVDPNGITIGGNNFINLLEERGISRPEVEHLINSTGGTLKIGEGLDWTGHKRQRATSFLRKLYKVIYPGPVPKYERKKLLYNPAYDFIEPYSSKFDTKIPVEEKDGNTIFTFDDIQLIIKGKPSYEFI